MLYTFARKLLRGYSILIALVILVFAGYNALRYFGYLEPGLCEARPAYNADVPAAVRERVDFLFDGGLLYCGEAKAGLATVAPMVYWGSDGSRSTIFFQALPGSTMAEVGVTEYVFGDEILPGPIGDARPDGYAIDAAGRPVWLNQAEAPDASYFFREDGAPAPWDVSMRLTVAGPALEQDELRERDFEQDIERIWGALRGQGGGEGRRVYRPVTLRILPERWEALVSRGEVNPALADEKGELNIRVLATTEQPQPALLRTVAGPSASTVWVAGVITGTRPALALAAPSGAAGAAIGSIAEGVWGSPLGPLRLAHFAFDPQPLGQVFEARYWNDARQRETAPPDYTWPVVFTPRPVDASPSAAPSAAP